MIKRKTASSIHVEMLISFIIFVSFIVFMFIAFKPLRISEQKDSSLALTESKIQDYIARNLTVTSVKLNSASSGCYSLPISLTNPVIVKDTSGDLVTANHDPSKVYFSSAGSFYQIYSGEGLVESPSVGSCSSLGPADYTISSRKLYQIPSIMSLSDLFSNYSENISALKETLNLKNDFNILLKKDNNIIFEGQSYKPNSVDIMARDIPIQLYDENASITSAILNVQVWR
jgi:hypothetical protein